MKKMAFLGILLMAVVVTSYSVSGTYAKYTSSYTLTSDTARVAKWKIGGEDITINLFEDSYNDNSVKSDTAGKDVVAPGTSGKYQFTFDGMTNVETNYKLSLSAADSTNTVKIDGYSPIKFYIAEWEGENEPYANAAAIDEAGKTWVDFETFKTNIANLYSTKVFSPETSTFPKYTIYWKWDFAGDDEKDTALGNAIVADEAAHKIQLKVKVTAEQTKEAAN